MINQYEPLTDGELKLANEICYHLSQRIWTSPKETRFVHYTSWESAKSIIAGKTLWLSDLLCMADKSELVEGAYALKECLKTVTSTESDERSAMATDNLMTAAEEVVSYPTAGIHVLSMTSGCDSKRHWLDYACAESGIALELRVGDAFVKSLPVGVGYATLAQVQYLESGKRDMMNQLAAAVQYVYGGGIPQPPRLSRERWINVLAYSISRLFLAAVALTKTPSHAWEKETRLLVMPEVSSVVPRPGGRADYDRPILALRLGQELNLTKVCFRVPPCSSLRYRSLELLRRDSGLDFEIEGLNGHYCPDRP
ncbi:MAG: hypothetical protein H3C58_00955 [Fimbriimonadaceae bacterium]|nr:hypothetical protein [Fimbriimonadaceae bacterium]